MNKFDELVHDLCPDGVERVALKRVAKTVAGLRGKTKKDFEDGNARFASYSNIFNNPKLDLKDPEFVKVAEGENQNELQYGDVLITGSSEVHEEVGMSSVVTEPPKEVIYLNSFCFALRFSDPETVLPEFASHLFRSEEVRKQIVKTANGVTRFNITKARFMAIEIPLPPLEIQQEIVRILDLFVDLDRELEQEIIGRERQKIATSHALFEKLKHFPRIALKNAGTWFGGGTPSKKNESFWQNGTIAWVSPKDMQDHTVTRTIDYITNEAVEGSSTKLVPAGSTALVARSSILEKKLPVAYFPQEVAMNQDLKAVFPSDELNGRYLFNALEEFRESILLRARNTGGSAASLDTKRLMAFQIPLPPLEVQEEIASKLDTFIEYIDNLKRERELRQKQYAHYRDLLLDLPVKE